jgi:hypothetical protein
MVAAAPFIFQVYVQNGRPAQGGDPKEYSVLVEISPEVLHVLPGGQSKDKAELDHAQRIARQAAFEAIGSEREGECSIAQIGEVPSQIRDREVTLQKNGVRVWVVGDSRAEVAGSR